MGQNAAQLFRPGKGATLSRYTAAVVAETMYPADWVQLNATNAPSAQGVSGAFEGQTLGSADYIEMLLADSSVIGCGSLLLGVLMGKGIGAVKDWTNVSSNVMADQDVGVIQSFGVHPQGRQVATGLLGDYLTLTTAGEMLNGVSGTVTGVLNPAGVCLANTTTYTRITAADQDGSPVFISRLT